MFKRLTFICTFTPNYMPLSTINIESELSYAYLHAVAASAGAICSIGERHDDDLGTDALVRLVSNFEHSYITDHTIHVQLKATVGDWGNQEDYRTHFIQGTERYNKLTRVNSKNHTVLIVL